jgi:hypothetical protein
VHPVRRAERTRISNITNPTIQEKEEKKNTHTVRRGEALDATISSLLPLPSTEAAPSLAGGG